MDNQSQSKSDKHILFVDDEPGVLRAIRRGLRRQKDWDQRFAEGAAQALAAMAETPVDIVVSDVTMPHTDGLAFLQRVRDEYPDTVRILMSGTAQGEVIGRAIPIAHRFLSKPWDIASLRLELERIFALRAGMNQIAIRTVVGGMSSLPVMPRVYPALRAALDDPTSRLDTIVDIIEQDPAVVARLLQIVNSAFFAAPRSWHDTGEVIRYLGTSVLKTLLVSAEIFTAFDEKLLPQGFLLSDLQRHAQLTGKIAGALSPGDRNRAYAAGLLHNIGKLIFADRMPTQWGEAYRQARREGRALADVEYEQFGTSYAEVGGYLLGIWGLPHDLVEAVSNHCDPMRSHGGELNLVAVTHLASVLAAQELGMDAQSFDYELLEKLDGARSLAAWRTMTAGMVQR